MNITTLVGILASIATSTSLLPQLIKIIREKKAESMSLWMLAVLFTGLSGWVIYGILKNDWIIILANSFSLVLNILITIFSIKYKQKI